MRKMKSKRNNKITIDEAYKKLELPRFVICRDMKGIYRGLYSRFPEGFPEVFVVDKLPNNRKIMKSTLQRGTVAIFVKDDEDEVLLSLLVDEIESPKCEEIPFPMATGHILSNKEVSRGLMFACYMADILEIDLPQIMFTYKEEFCGYHPFFLTFIDSDLCVIEQIISIAHELRHAWQNEHHPDWFDNYIKSDKDLESYRNQIAEIDAEAFALKVESIITGVDFMNSYAGLEMDPTNRELIIDRMQEIDVKMSPQTIVEIRKLIELDDLLRTIVGKNKMRTSVC